MWNIIKMMQKNLFTKQKLTDIKTNLMVKKGGGNHGGEGGSRRKGILYSYYCIK